MLRKKISEIVNNLKLLYQKLHDESESKVLPKKFSFIFFSSSFVILFYLIFFLSGTNPYSLLNPFSIYDFSLPIRDNRELAVIYLSDGKRNIFPARRRIYLKDQTDRMKIITLMKEVSEPPFYEVEDNLSKTELNVNYKKLPAIHFTVNAIWFQNKNLILDLRSSTIQEELDQMKVRIDKSTYEIGEDKDTGKLSDLQVKEEKNKSRLAEVKKEMMFSAFLAVEKTIFDNFSNIDSITFRLDGINKNFTGLDYPFTEIKQRKK